MWLIKPETKIRRETTEAKERQEKRKVKKRPNACRFTPADEKLLETV